MKTLLLTLSFVALGAMAPASLQAQCSGCEGKKKDSKKEASIVQDSSSFAGGCSGCEGKKKDSNKEASTKLAGGCSGCEGKKKDSNKEAMSLACGNKDSKTKNGSEARV